MGAPPAGAGRGRGMPMQPGAGGFVQNFRPQAGGFYQPQQMQFAQQHPYAQAYQPRPAYAMPGYQPRPNFLVQPTQPIVYQARTGQAGAPANADAAPAAATAKAPARKPVVRKPIAIFDPSTDDALDMEVIKKAAPASKGPPPATAKATPAPATATPAAATTAATTAATGPASGPGTPAAERKSHAIMIEDGPPAKKGEKKDTPATNATPTTKTPAAKPTPTAAPAKDAGAAPKTDDAPKEPEKAAAADDGHVGPRPGKGQWTPQTTAGRKAYSLDFMRAFDNVCSAAPPDFRTDIAEIMQQAQQQQRPQQQSRGGLKSGGSFKDGPDWMTGGGGGGGGFGGNRGAPPRGGNQRGPQQGNQGRNSGGGFNNRASGGGGGNRRGGNNGKVISLPPREAPKLQKAKDAWSGAKAKPADEKEKMLKNVTALLNKLTLEKFDTLSTKIMELLLTDLSKLGDFVQHIFGKAIDESFFSMIYAKLCRKLADAKERHPDGQKDEKTGQIAMVPLVKDFRKILLNRCQQEFETASLADHESNQLKKAADEKDAKEEKKLTKEEEAAKREAEREAGYSRNKVKRHMLGNIKFIGELFKEDIVPAKIMMHCINHLMPNVDADEESLENLCKLLDTAGGKLEANMSKSKDKIKQIKKVFELMEKTTGRKGLSSRIKFAIADILDMRQRRWKHRIEQKGPKTIEEVHKEAQKEQLKIQQQNKGGGGGGYHGGGGNRRDSRNSSYGSNSHIQQVVTRRPEKVDANRFSGGGKSLGGLGGSLGSLGSGFKLGGSSKSRGGPATGDVQGGRYVKKGPTNSFAALSSTRSKIGGSKIGGGSPQLEKKGNSLLAKRTQIRAKAESPVTATAAPAAADEAAVAPCKFSDEELEKKTKGAVSEYLSIKDIKEIKLSIEEWGHTDATKALATKVITIGLDAKVADQNTLQGLLFQLVGKPGGIPAAVFIECVKDNFALLEDLKYDVPNVHKYLAGFIAAASGSDKEACKVLLELKDPAVIDLLGASDFGLKIALEVFAATKQKKADHIALFKSLDLDLQLLLPEDRRADGTLADLCDRAGVTDLLEAGKAVDGATEATTEA